jgi:hypothetical protein
MRMRCAKLLSAIFAQQEKARETMNVIYGLHWSGSVRCRGEAMA